MTVRVSEIVSNYWKFTRVDGEGALIAPVVRFWPSGMVGGYIVSAIFGSPMNRGSV